MMMMMVRELWPTGTPNPVFLIDFDHGTNNSVIIIECMCVYVCNVVHVCMYVCMCVQR